MCVCGCPPAEHRPVVMSVPLPAHAKPLYPLPVGGARSIATTYPTSTYCRDECSCGCCGEYLADQGD